MQKHDPQLLLQHSPILRHDKTTPGVMLDVLLALSPVTIASIWLFGLSAIVVLAACISGAALTEYFFTPTSKRRRILLDGSGLTTGLLLGLTLPPALPAWMAFLGGVVAIGLGKIIWGGLGSNLFNPALVGRAFLLATFPNAMTTWVEPAGSFWNLPSSTLSLPFTLDELDAVSGATPLGLMKFEQQGTPFLELFLGNTAGSLGETSGLLLILGAAYLLLRGDMDWRIPVGILLTAMLFSGALSLVDPTVYPTPLFSVFSGGLLLGALFMATDPVTSPSTPTGAWLFAIGIGVLVILIRVFGGLPEGVMYAILLMNAASPLIERFTQPRVFGYDREDSS
ncbi:MAG: RnfABCDGE type electron transport complex subunit D [Gammaproteobacteria bacterium]|nr:RnfABCDGE type electron transport complex subunit D [Gammaproteobacteria bacterium]